MAEIQIKISQDELILQKDFKIDSSGKIYVGKDLAGQEVTVIILKKKPAEASL